jgi:hypothetical protein
VDNIETTVVTFTVSNNTDTTHVTTTGQEANVSGVEFDKVNDFAGFQIQFHGVVGFNQRIRVTQSAAIVSDSKWNTLGTSLNFFDFAQFVLKCVIIILGRVPINAYLGLFRGDAVNGETTLDIINQTEVFTSLFNGDHI